MIQTASCHIASEAKRQLLVYVLTYGDVPPILEFGLRMIAMMELAKYAGVKL